MKANYLVKGICSFLILTFSQPPNAQQTDKSQVVQDSEAKAQKQPKLPFIAAPEVLANNIDKANLAWINIMEQQHLVLKRTYSGRVYRGNAILFHAQGENAIHQRLINPLSLQLSNLGWNTFSPNIGLSDFPKQEKLNKSIQQTQSNGEESSIQNDSSQNEAISPPNVIEAATESNSEDKSVMSYFKSSESYQEYFSLVCQETLKLVTISQEPTILLANGEAAYWVLECVRQISPQTPVVLIQPKAPSFAKNNMELTLESFNNPIFTFSVENYEDNFVKLVEKRKRKSFNQRINRTALVNSKINIENTSVAKLITGWIKKINSQAQ